MGRENQHPGQQLPRGRYGRAVVAPDVPQPQIEALCRDPAELLWGNIGRPVKIDRTSLMVRADLALPERTLHVAYKRYLPRNGWKTLCSLLRPSEVWRDWTTAHELVARGIPTATPVAVVTPSWCQLDRRGYLATEWIKSTENLHMFAWRLAELPVGQRLRRAAVCAESLGRLIGKMHAQHISHRDLKGSNLLVKQDDVAGSWPTETYIVDMKGVRVFGRRTVRRAVARRVSDLARLAASIEAHPWVSFTVRLRFIRAYHVELGRVELNSHLTWKHLWQAVAGRSRQLVEKKRRRGKPVL